MGDWVVKADRVIGILKGEMQVKDLPGAMEGGKY